MTSEGLYCIVYTPSHIIWLIFGMEIPYALFNRLLKIKIIMQNFNKKNYNV